MKNFLYQSNIHMKRQFIRKPTAVFFSTLFPILFYALYTKVFTMPISGEALRKWNIDYLISMVIYGVLITAITNTAVALLEDHLNHFDLFVDLSPTPKWQYYLSMMIVYVPFYLFLMALLGIEGYFLNEVVLDFSQWAGFFLAMLVGLIPFSLIGMLISLAGNQTAVNVLSNLVAFPMAILGGLWWPIDFMPQWLQDIGRRLPTYHVAEIIRRWVHDEKIIWESAGVLVIWTLILLVCIIIVKSLLKRREPQLI